jgi:hypothetical protein
MRLLSLLELEHFSLEKVRVKLQYLGLVIAESIGKCL